MKIVMPYIGKSLSVNSYRIRYGRIQTTKIKPETKMWMAELSEKVRDFDHDHTCNIIVSVFGKFRDGRVPDLDNLAKVILDAIKVGVGLDDRHMRYVSVGYDTGYDRPELEIELQREVR